MNPDDQINDDDMAALQQAHDAAMGDLGAESALDVPPPAPAPELEIPVPEVAMPVEGPMDDVAKLATEHDAALTDLGEISAKETPPPRSVHGIMPQQNVEANARQRAAERKERLGKPPPQAKHNQAFVELGNVVREEPGEHADAPEPIALPPDAVADVANPGEATKEHLNTAFADFLREDKAWRTEVQALLKMMAHEIGQQRLELDQIRRFLEAIRE